MRRVEADTADDERRERHLTKAERRDSRAQHTRPEHVWVDGGQMNLTKKKSAGEKWQIDRNIPVAVIFTLAMQTLTFVIFLTRLDGRVTVLEADRTAKEWQSERIIRMDERLTALQNGLVEIKTLLRPQQQPLGR